MLELTWIPEALQTMAWAQLAAGPVALICALFLPKTWPRKIVWSVAALTIWIGIPRWLASDAPTPQEIDEDRKMQQQMNAAQLRFKALCETAGEKINRTVEGVDGFLLMGMRPKQTNLSDQFAMDDPYGQRTASGGGEDFVFTLLVDTYNAAEGEGAIRLKQRLAYRYVDVIDEAAERHRYTVRFVPRDPAIYTKGEGDYVLEKNDAMNLPSPRYGVKWEDISTRKDRNYWIAGGSIKIIDLKNGMVIAERRGYMIDPAQGSTTGFRSPWLGADRDGRSCPTWKEHHLPFISKVLKRRVN